MTGPIAAWLGIVASPFWSAYVREVHSLAKQIASDVARVIADVPNNGHFLRVDPELHARIIEVVFKAGRLRALLRSRDARSLPSEERAVLTARTRALRDILHPVDLTPVLDGSARDSIEHFDERLDREAIRSLNGVTPRPTVFGLDLVVSSRSAFESLTVNGRDAAHRYLRVYLAEERLVVSCDSELKLEPLGHCSASIRDRLETSIPELAGDGALLLVVK